MSSLSEREVEYSALAIFILSHGEKNNILMAADNKYNLRLITDSLIPDYCPGLIEKPKIIFIQVRPCNYSVSPKTHFESIKQAFREHPESNQTASYRRSLKYFVLFDLR